jgi:hypothetical protein
LPLGPTEDLNPVRQSAWAYPNGIPQSYQRKKKSSGYVKSGYQYKPTLTRDACTPLDSFCNNVSPSAEKNDETRDTITAEYTRAAETCTVTGDLGTQPPNEEGGDCETDFGSDEGREGEEIRVSIDEQLPNVAAQAWEDFTSIQGCADQHASSASAACRVFVPEEEVSDDMKGEEGNVGYGDETRKWAAERAKRQDMPNGDGRVGSLNFNKNDTEASDDDTERENVGAALKLQRMMNLSASAEGKSTGYKEGTGTNYEKAIKQQEPKAPRSVRIQQGVGTGGVQRDTNGSWMAAKVIQLGPEKGYVRVDVGAAMGMFKVVEAHLLAEAGGPPLKERLNLKLGDTVTVKVKQFGGRLRVVRMDIPGMQNGKRDRDESEQKETTSVHVEHATLNGHTVQLSVNTSVGRSVVSTKVLQVCMVGRAQIEHQAETDLIGVGGESLKVVGVVSVHVNFKPMLRPEGNCEMTFRMLVVESETRVCTLGADLLKKHEAMIMIGERNRFGDRMSLIHPTSGRFAVKLTATRRIKRFSGAIGKTDLNPSPSTRRHVVSMVGLQADNRDGPCKRPQTPGSAHALGASEQSDVKKARERLLKGQLACWQAILKEQLPSGTLEPYLRSYKLVRGDARHLAIKFNVALPLDPDDLADRRVPSSCDRQKRDMFRDGVAAELCPEDQCSHCKTFCSLRPARSG